MRRTNLYDDIQSLEAVLQVAAEENQAIREENRETAARSKGEVAVLVNVGLMVMQEVIPEGQGVGMVEVMVEMMVVVVMMMMIGRVMMTMKMIPPLLMNHHPHQAVIKCQVWCVLRLLLEAELHAQHSAGSGTDSNLLSPGEVVQQGGNHSQAFSGIVGEGAHDAADVHVVSGSGSLSEGSTGTVECPSEKRSEKKSTSSSSDGKKNQSVSTQNEGALYM